jgi:hypothetical protein
VAQLGDGDERRGRLVRGDAGELRGVRLGAERADDETEVMRRTGLDDVTLDGNRAARSAA